MRGIATFASLVLVASLGAGCQRRVHNPFVRDAHASATPPSPGMPVDARTAAAFTGEDPDEMAPGTHKQSGKGSGQGMNKWRDTGVYVDGRPVGVLDFGELPIGLKPTWIPEEHSIEFDYGYKGPRTRTTYARRYKFIDFLRAVGIDVSKVKEIHIMGPHLTSVLIASGKELRSKKGQELMFRFGAITGGKALPVVPADFGNGKHMDKISAVMVYINKKPPTLDEEEGLELDGKPVDGIPYYGEPMRGGVRVYANDLLQLQIKKQALHDLPGELGPDGKQRWKLWKVLAASGIDTSKIVEGWAIADERRKQKFSRAELEQLTFTMNERNEILVGDQKILASALALHNHALKPDELPQIRPDEE
jgi:hypothetical protein